jgi:mannan endo-1,4-beta-mannosidase
MVLIAAGLPLSAHGGEARNLSRVKSATMTRSDRSPEATTVLKYLRRLGHGEYLFGQMGTWVHNENPDIDDASNWIRKVRDHTGKWPAYGCITYDFEDEPFSDAAFNRGVKKLWDRGMIPGIYSWWANPSNPTGRASTKCEVGKIFVKAANPVKAQFYRQMDRMAANMKQLEKWKVPVIYTPFVELDHGKKWFGTDGKQNAIRLHRLVHDYFVKTKGLKNILWGYHTGSNGRLKAFYPGDAYVDVMGHSVYHRWGNPKLDFYDYTWAVAKKRDKGKAIWIPELGINSQGKPPRDCFDVLKRLENDYPELCGMVWWGDNAYYNVIGNARGVEFTRDAKVITLDELPVRQRPGTETRKRE